MRLISRGDLHKLLAQQHCRPFHNGLSTTNCTVYRTHTPFREKTSTRSLRSRYQLIHTMNAFQAVDARVVISHIMLVWYAMCTCQ
jgi:hypothetical protein